MLALLVQALTVASAITDGAGATRPLAGDLVASLEGQLSPDAQVLLPMSAEYKRDIVLKSTQLNAFPHLVVHPATVQDVIIAVNFAAANNLQITVRGTGHDYNGRGSADGSLNINTRPLRRIQPLDSTAGTVTFETGVVFGEVLFNLQAQGLTLVTGHDPTVGPGGCLTGGCHSIIGRQYGLGADNVVSIVLVTPEGRLVRASNAGVHAAALDSDGHVAPQGSADELITADNSLFWALRGAGMGSFGVLVEVTAKVHPRPEAVQAMTFAFPLYTDAAETVPNTGPFHRFIFNASWWESLPPTLSSYITHARTQDCMVRGPARSKSCNMPVQFALLYAGSDPAELNATQGVQELMADPALTLASYTWLGTEYTGLAEVGAPGGNYGRGFVSNVFLQEGDLNAGTTELIFAADATLKAVITPDPQAVANGSLVHDINGFAFFDIIGVFGGAMRTHPDAANTCISPLFRNAHLQLVLGAGSSDPHFDVPAMTAVSNAMAPLYDAYYGVFVNEYTTLEGYNVIPQWQQRFWGDNYPRLLDVKAAWDPAGRMVVPFGVGWQEA